LLTLLPIQQTHYFFKAVEHFKPKTASMENVTGLYLDKSKQYLQSVVVSLLSIGYQVRVEILNASSFGDAQNRKRVILFASQRNLLLPSSPLTTRPKCLPFKTCKDAIGMLEGFSPSESGVICIGGKTIYNHSIVKANLKDDDWVLKAEEPSRTVLAKSRSHVHYNGKRMISVREGKFKSNLMSVNKELFFLL
jgi:site-specific DNA-cytosine methylase